MGDLRAALFAVWFAALLIALFTVATFVHTCVWPLFTRVCG